MCQKPIFENINAYKKQRKKCASLRRQCIKQHLAKITEVGITRKRNFGTLLNLSSQIKASQKIMTSLSKTKKIITDEKKLADLFNSHYVNTVEISSGSGINSETISSTCNMNDTDEVQHIVNLYKDHPSIK